MSAKTHCSSLSAYRVAKGEEREQNTTEGGSFNDHPEELVANVVKDVQQ